MGSAIVEEEVTILNDETAQFNKKVKKNEGTLQKVQVIVTKAEHTNDKDNKPEFI